jgi:tetratricopeptide (TPR) repeat protein
VGAPALVSLVGRQRAAVLEQRLSEAATAFEAERFIDARRILRALVREVPDLPEARELLGLTLYRLGSWRDATTQLEQFVELTGGSTEQHPVLADCYRALGRHARVAELWEELRQSSPGAHLVNEGRIVAAGSLADQGRMAEAITLLAKGFALPRAPRDHHLRRAYALADLYERSGDLPQARRLFARVAAVDPEFVDVGERLEALGR